MLSFYASSSAIQAQIKVFFFLYFSLKLLAGVHSDFSLVAHDALGRWIL